jgi:hypothetical protein
MRDPMLRDGPEQIFRIETVLEHRQVGMLKGLPRERAG